MEITIGDVVRHPYWQGIIERLVSALATIYKESIPAPKIWPHYEEPDSRRLMIKEQGGYRFTVGQGFMYSGNMERVTLLVQGINRIESRRRPKTTYHTIVRLTWDWRLRAEHGVFSGLERKEGAWKIEKLDMENLGLLPMIVEEIGAVASVDRGEQQDRETRRKDYLDALANLSKQYLGEEEE